MGMPPFYSDDITTLYQNIQKGALDFPRFISPEGADLIKV